MKKYFIALFFVAVSLLTGVIGSLFTAPAISTWYDTLAKPSFNPPSWIFGPVWTILYVLMGLSAYLVWSKREGNRVAKLATILFFVHLLFNATWSILFFGFKDPMLALIDIVVLWSMIVTLTVLYFDIDKKAAYLMLPYLAWVSFATVLNYSILALN